jgi:hypothetical protein
VVVDEKSASFCQKHPEVRKPAKEGFSLTEAGASLYFLIKIGPKFWAQGRSKFYLVFAEQVLKDDDILSYL